MDNVRSPLTEPVPSWRLSAVAALRVYLPWRVLLSLWAAVIVALFPIEMVPGRSPTADYVDAAPDDTVLSDYVLEPWLRWDAIWYTHIAHYGYVAANPGASAFSPLYPALIAPLARLLAGRYLLAALLISNIAAYGMLVLLHRLVALEYSRPLADRTLLVVVVFPSSFYLLAPYTESLFLVLALGTFLAARRGSWALAGVLGALATLARWQGVLLAAALGWQYVETIRAGRPWRDWASWTLRQWRRWLPALWLGLIPLALVGMLFYLRSIVGQPLPWESLEARWAGTFTWPWRGIARTALAFVGALDPIQSPTVTLVSNWIATLLCAAALIAYSRRAARLGGVAVACAIYGWSQLLLPASRLIGGNILQSLPRYVLLVFPMFIVLAWMSRHERRLHQVMLLGGMGLLMAFSAMYFVWLWFA